MWIGSVNFDVMHLNFGIDNRAATNQKDESKAGEE